MAKNSFGSYSSVPRSTGLGDGGAQVFAPQAIGLDASGLAQGIASAGAAVGGAIAGKKQAINLQKAEFGKKLSDIKGGVYSQNNAATDYAIGQLQEGMTDGSITQSQGSDILDGIIRNKGSINDFEKSIVTPSVQKGFEDPNKQTYREGEGWGAFGDSAIEQYSGDLTDEQKAIIDKDLTMGVYNQGFQNSYSDLEDSSIIYDPEFSLAGAMLTEFSKFTQGSKSSDVAAAVTKLQEGYDLKTIFEEYPDMSEQFLEYMGTRTDIADKWANNYIVENGLSPYSKNTPDFKILAMDAMMEEAGEVTLPKQKSTKRMSVVEEPKEESRGGGNPSFMNFGFSTGVQTVEVNEDGTFVKRSVLGVGDKTIAGESIQGTAVKDGKRLAVDASGNVMPDSEDVAKSYINSVISTLDVSEKKAYLEALDEQLKVKPIIVKADPEKENNLLNKLEKEGSVFGDDESAILKYLGDELGADFSDKENKAIKDSMLKFLKDNSISNFTKEDDRKAIVNKLKEDFPRYFASDELVEEKPLIEGVPDKDVKDAAKASGMSVDEYIKRYNAENK